MVHGLFQWESKLEAKQMKCQSPVLLLDPQESPEVLETVSDPIVWMGPVA